MFYNWNRWLLASVCLASAVLVTSTPVGPLYQREGYFNGSAYIRLLSSLSLKHHIGLSFRTCHGGELFSQSSAGNNVSLVVGNDGLLFSITLLNKRYESRLGADLLDNTWHTVNIIHRLGNLTLSTAGHQQVVANSTFNSEILQYADLLSEKSVLIVGKDFQGCILNGPGIIFDATNMEAHNIEWGQCPLNTNSCSPCFRNGENRCLNNGRCEEDSSGNYQCICNAGHTGQHCETEVSSHLCENNPCRNEGSCHVSPQTGRYCTCQPGYTGSNCETNLNECQSNPCLHGGECVDGINNYTCECGRTGYKGHNCEININECENNPCLYNGKCFDTYGSYTCECAAGYGGSNCEQNLDECSSTPCLNNGTCVDLLGRYQCTCQPGFNGPNCEHNIDDCEGNKCPPNSKCLDGVNSYQCACKVGYLGVPPNCAEANSCQSVPCANGGVCNNFDGFYNCTCPLGFTGVHCELPQQLAPRSAYTDWCSTLPCRNGGSCLDSVCHCAPAFTGAACEAHIGCAANPCEHVSSCQDYLGGYVCNCEPGWSGQNCNVAENTFDCSVESCQNAGTCINVGNSHLCNCRAGYAGKMCQIDIDECDSSPCVNGGICVDQANGYVCNCSQDFMGTNCELDMDACAFKPCRNGGTCIGKRGRREYHCQCSLGFEGRDCQTNVNDCVGITCPEGKTCVDGINSYECRCLNGLSGENCSQGPDPCLDNPCKNNGTCEIYGDGNKCSCPAGFQGKYCEEDVDECALNSTICHNGICRNKVGGYECYCRPGFSGDNCQLDINECLTTPCNNGTCTDRVNMFECTCFPGYTGKVCNENIDECASNPCFGGSTCIDEIAAYSCVCPAGLEGERCEINIDECASSPCQNGGVCEDEINGYFCNCSGTGFTETHCEVNIDDCIDGICKNGGTCVDLINSYKCECHLGYTDPNCEKDILECESAPCQFGGTCLEYSNASLYYQPGENTSDVLAMASPAFEKEFSYASANGYECVCVPGVQGENCQVNIDECASNPCHAASKCVDGIGNFVCDCSPGFEGVLCDIEIDECELLKPCIFGECIDKLADYLCECRQGYGGKNCSEKLTGCDEDRCLNNGTCKPYLENETEHKFNCSCSNGYHGAMCEKITTMSLDGAGYVKANTSRDEGYDIQFRFRTSLPTGLVALGHGLTYYVLGLVDGRLNLHSSLLNKWEGVFIGSSLNDSAWHKVFVAINNTHLVMAANEEQTIYPIDRREDVNATYTSFPTTYLGGAVANLRKLVLKQVNVEWPHFIGCMEDIVINDNWVLPNDTSLTDVTSIGVEEGCRRTEQCKPNPCQNNGRCTDRWKEFVCACERPYMGHNCQHMPTAATFGYENVSNSLVTVTVGDAERKAVRSIMDISMFVRTREEKGDIFHMGTADSSPNKTFIAAHLEGGELGVKIQFNGNNESYTVGGVKLSDGNNHLIQVVRNVTLIQVKINGTEYFRKTISATGQLDVQVLRLGSFKGVIQDVQIRNGTRVMVVEFYPLEADDDLDMLRPFGEVILNEVEEGIVSDNSCRDQPCMNNGTCHITWNDYRCDCLRGSKGKNCQEMEFCQVKYCPPASICHNLDDGYECVANMTFDGVNTTLDFALNYPLPVPEEAQPPLNTLEINYRSQTGGTLLYISSDNDDKFVSVSVYRDEVTVAWKLDNSTVGRLHRFRKESDGNWSTVILTVKESGSIEGGFKGASEESGQSFNADNFPLGAWEELVRHGKIALGSGAEVRGITDFTAEYATVSDKHSYAVIGGETTVGEFGTVNPMDVNDVDVPMTAVASASSPLVSLTRSYFKGCLGEVRIGNFLLPFFTSESLRSANYTGTDYFLLTSGPDDGNISCVLCFEKECQNEGTCSDPSESYSCKCQPGFRADDCSINIDECQENACQNGAVCIDGIANYTCQCALGWEGWLCNVDIDECASNPCQNNGSCADLLGSFQCNCTEEFMGDHCEFLKPITCENYPCRNGSTCRNVKNPVTNDNFTCTCVPGYEGSTCDVAYCEVDPCLNGGFCDTSDVSPKCQCAPGFTGRNCEENIDDCAAGPENVRCLHNGRCTDGINQFTCNCTGTGFTGVYCEEDVNECDTGEAICGQGMCVNNVGSFNCACDRGACGTACQFTDPCSDLQEQPCQHDGVCTPNCVDAPNFSCECSEGWAGSNCTVLVEAQGSNAIDVAIIVAPIVGALILIGAISVSFFVSMARKKRATRGTYSPSSQEYCNPRVEMDNVMKPPPEERLI